MRKFDRTAEPAVLKENGPKWTLQWTNLLARNKSAQFQWYKTDGKKCNEHILPELRKQTADHCTFCDAFPVDGVSNNTIEHFRPKTRFPPLAYNWTNLFYCCDACQSAKREQWDESLLNPDAPDYDFQRYFEFDFTTGAINANSIATESDRARATKTIELYGLDLPSRRRNRLLEQRRRSRLRESDDEIHLWAYRDFLGLMP